MYPELVGATGFWVERKAIIANAFYALHSMWKFVLFDIFQNIPFRDCFFSMLVVYDLARPVEVVGHERKSDCF